jgi:hypothetical protein
MRSTCVVEAIVMVAKIQTACAYTYTVPGTCFQKRQEPTYVR